MTRASKSRESAEADVVYYRELRPSAELAPFVECFWHLKTELGGSWEPVYPDGCTEVILNRGEPADQWRRGRAVRQARYFAIGPTDSLIRVRSATRSDVLGIRLTPWGAHPLFGVSTASLTGTSVELGAVAPALARGVVSIVESEPSLASVARRLDAYLRRWLDSRGRSETPDIAPVARHLTANGGVRLDEMERFSGWSVRTLQRRFKTEIGLSPKRFSRVARFLRFMRLTELEPHATIATLAVAAGYYDQSHLHSDSLRFTGQTPASYRDREPTSFDPFYESARLARLVTI